MLHYSNPQIVLQEVPGELSLAIAISGCQLRCPGCHSKETYNVNYGTKLTIESIDNLIYNNKHITCILFYGGEWEPIQLAKILNRCKNYHKLKTCLYTGLELKDISKDLLRHLTFIKTGPYIESLGGLGSETTNQKFIKL